MLMITFIPGLGKNDGNSMAFRYLLTEPTCDTGCLSITLRDIFVAGVAVAVSAITGIPGKSLGKSTKRPYSGLSD